MSIYPKFHFIQTRQITQHANYRTLNILYLYEMGLMAFEKVRGISKFSNLRTHPNKIFKLTFCVDCAVLFYFSSVKRISPKSFKTILDEQNTQVLEKLILLGVFVRNKRKNRLMKTKQSVAVVTV